MNKWRVFEKEDHRKLHGRSVPSIGGLVVVLVVLVVSLFAFDLQELGQLKYFIGSMGLMALVGLRDDLLPLNAPLKIASQLVPALIVFFLFDIKISSFFSIYNEPFPIWIALVITCFTIIIITNSLNLIDGIDGLSGSLSLVSLSVLTIIFFNNGDMLFGLFLSLIVGALLGFVYFNYPPAKVFIGDTGALFLGFVLACAVIRFMNLNESLVGENRIHESSVALAMTILYVPLFDTLRLIILRIASGRSPMHAGRDHIHHLLGKLGWRDSKITIVLTAIQISAISVVLLFPSMNDLLIFLILGGSGWVLYYFGLIKTIERRLKTKTKESGI